MRFNTVWLTLILASLASAADKPPVPDFSAGDHLPKDSHHDWNLGPTGARGWVYAWRGESTDCRQILVTSVDAGSPAEGVLAQDDVILGVGDHEFDTDARISFAKAITAAEAGDGELKLTRWRSGLKQQVTLELEPLGSYSPTAPLNCEKSRRILQIGCERLADRRQRELGSASQLGCWI